MLKNLCVKTFVALLGMTAIASAAQQAGSSRTGNPTPGTPQPDPPNLADRITLTGCIERAQPNSAKKGASAEDPNTPSDTRFVLTKAERKNVVPVGTGTSSPAEAPAGRSYRLHAIDSQLSVFVGTKVEISGEVQPPAPNAAGEADAKVPTLLVEFVQKLAQTCQ